ncbi:MULTISPECIES: hypothetical protein [Mesonia]|uniref:Uncharacterized protein n=1 Tax=Mesonia oceanica TaxID=2687242 RepID=A0AC61YA21_9FLAO|nr:MULTISPECIES: hypothetical protein [Mesonia]MAN29036.1 hypothetical protein [Mesonia sp.]VVV01281.1 hypothetical protein FVB9532_02571 [Mesonia oceanica]
MGYQSPFDKIHKELADSSPFGEQSIFNQPKWKKILLEYLIKQDIQEFIYSNTSTIDGIPIIIRIHGIIKDEKLYIKTQSIASNQGTYAPFNTGEDFIANIQELNYLQQSIYFLVYKQKSEWVLCDRTIDNGFTTHLADNLLLGSRFLNDAEYQQIYNEFKDCPATKNNLLLEHFNKLSIQLNEQLLKEFYSEVDLAISLKLVDANQQTIAEQTIRRNLQKKTNDLLLDITLFADGSIKINHKISPEYLKDYEKKWQEEANARGLKIQVKDLRQEVIAYLQSEEAQLSFGDKFLREVRTWWDDGVGNYLEAFQATQKITQHIWAEGTINRGVWHSTKEDAKEYNQWPNYMHLEPVLGGATDGLVDEIVGIPLACKSVYEIASDEEKREAFLQVFTKEGINKLIDGFKEQATGILNDPQRQEHFAGQTTVSIASMFAGVGFVGKMGKLDELSDLVTKAVKRGDEFIDGAATLGKIDKLKKLARHIDNEKAIDGLIEEFGSARFENHLDELLEAANNIKERKLVEVIKRFRLGRKLENNVTERIEKELLLGSGDYIDELAKKMGKSLEELADMPRLTQLQLHLPKEELLKYAKKGTKLENIKDSYVILDDAFVETIRDFDNEIIGYKLFANETKLSNLSPLTNNQKVFQKMLKESKLEFSIRSKDPAITKGILEQGARVNIEKWIQTTGKGVEKATDITTKSLF